MQSSAIAVQSNRDLSNSGVTETRLNYHFRREFHSRTPLLQTVVMCPCETAQAAIDIMDWSVKPSSCQPRKHWIAPPSMQKRHCLRHHFASTFWQPAPLHQVVTFSQLRDQSG